jgi:hypothetical protein
MPEREIRGLVASQLAADTANDPLFKSRLMYSNEADLVDVSLLNDTAIKSSSARWGTGGLAEA